MKKINHLSEISDFYDDYIIDLWGVMHNGIVLYPKAMNVIKNLYEKEKKITFLSNAPRPSNKVVEFLKKLKLDEKYLKNVVTSGEAASKAIKDEILGKKFYHLGPQRDNSLFYGLEKNKTSIDKCDFILCTGLFDGEEKNLNYYSSLLQKHTSKKFMCTNPDLTVHRGNIEEYCAGTIASIFEKLGGTVVYFGKPHSEIYKLCLKKNKKTLIIGDNLRTDIKGANNLNLDSLFIYEGVHKLEIKDEKEIESLLKKYKVNASFYQPRLNW